VTSSLEMLRKSQDYAFGMLDTLRSVSSGNDCGLTMSKSAPSYQTISAYRRPVFRSESVDFALASQAGR
jgi:hypothetical protein